MGDNNITISKTEYDMLSATKLKYDMLLEVVFDCMKLNYDKKRLRVYDNDSSDLGFTVKTIEPALYNSMFEKLLKEEKEKEENESID